MSDVANFSIAKIENDIRRVSNQVQQVSDQVSNMDSSVKDIDNKLTELQASFESFVKQQIKDSILQQASTEVVRVRQEIQNNFGNYKVVRETMLGVLQATDVALVKKTTISRVSEELMIAAPKYWLAPCLVAVAAWIGNDKELADRAIAEAVKRDEERTALTMALICRRNNRVQSCYEWLAIYFSKQRADSFTEATFTYIDAYINGVFGPDEKHICDDYVDKWLDEIKGSSDSFEQEQENMWKEYCTRFTADGVSEYPALGQCVREFDCIDGYLRRINSVGAISENFHNISTASVDQETLKRTIDKNLIALVNKYDEEEMPLRKEETYLKAVKRFEGDKEQAKKYISDMEQARKNEAVTLAEQMRRVIIAGDEVTPSQKKTALSFLRGYIKKGFNKFISEKKSDFPEAITMDINEWTGKTSDGSNKDSLISSYSDLMAQKRNQELEAINQNKPKNYMIATIAAAVFTLIMFFLVLPFAVVSGAIAIYLGIMINSSKKKIVKDTDDINQKYTQLDSYGRNMINLCIEQWNSAKLAVNEFNSRPVCDIME